MVLCWSPMVSLESLERRVSGKEKEAFIQFMKSMLTWLPEERKTAKKVGWGSMVTLRIRSTVFPADHQLGRYEFSGEVKRIQ